VIGGGLRLPPKNLALFETVVNVIHKTEKDLNDRFTKSLIDMLAALVRTQLYHRP
jgi:hypothetical protein